MQLTWLGHSCILLEGSRKVLVDPFVREGSVIGTNPDIVAVTHGHADHLGEAVALKRKTVAVGEVVHYLRTKGVPAESVNFGGTLELDGVSFTLTPAVHSSRIEDESGTFDGGAAAGFVIRMDGIAVYHAGDTALFSDMKLIGELYHPDIALLPIGGRYTMGPAEAMMAAQYIGARIVVPIHYNTWERIAADPLPFKNALERTTDITVKILKSGEGMDCSPLARSEERRVGKEC
mgnify:CR=1 FL=1